MPSSVTPVVNCAVYFDTWWTFLSSFYMSKNFLTFLTLKFFLQRFWHYSHSMQSRVCVRVQCLSVCLSHLSTAAAACCRFAVGQLQEILIDGSGQRHPPARRLAVLHSAANDCIQQRMRSLSRFAATIECWTQTCLHVWWRWLDAADALPLINRLVSAALSGGRWQSGFGTPDDGLSRDTHVKWQHGQGRSDWRAVSESTDRSLHCHVEGHRLHWRVSVEGKVDLCSTLLWTTCLFCLQCFCLQCFDAVGWVAGRASGL